MDKVYGVIETLSAFDKQSLFKKILRVIFGVMILFIISIFYHALRVNSVDSDEVFFKYAGRLSFAFGVIKFCVFFAVLFMIYFFLRCKQQGKPFMKMEYVLPSASLLIIIMTNLFSGQTIKFFGAVSKLKENMMGLWGLMASVDEDVLSSGASSIGIFYLIAMILLILSIVFISKAIKKEKSQSE